MNLLLSWLENLYILKNRSFNFSFNFVWQFLLQTKHFYSIKSSLKFVYFRKQWQYLYLILHVLLFLSLCPNLHLIVRIPSEKLWTRSNNELVINLVLSINCNMYDIFFVIFSPFLSIIVTSFSIGTVKVI